ncbi:hypothetical protein BDY19DRAFT_1058087 [Irpex rosettiformis]|uniref:Uncharacterized protein n=1 Tax=Irpex rosettiformis TaxID=378272 RepID=A0ACB8U0D1_9APHY|nr:hypothetical protein BDY19DRAFT_1058087 [Irpex rosettiformis]
MGFSPLLLVHPPPQALIPSSTCFRRSLLALTMAPIPTIIATGNMPALAMQASLWIDRLIFVVFVLLSVYIAVLVLAWVIRRAKMSTVAFIEKVQDKDLCLPTHLDSHTPRSIVLPLHPTPLKVETPVPNEIIQPLSEPEVPLTQATSDNIPLGPTIPASNSSTTSLRSLAINLDHPGSLITSWSLPPSESSFLYVEDGDLIKADANASQQLAEILPIESTTHDVALIVSTPVSCSSSPSLSSIDLDLDLCSGPLITSWSLPPSDSGFLYVDDDDFITADKGLDTPVSTPSSRPAGAHIIDDASLESIDLELILQRNNAGPLITSWSLPPSGSTGSSLYLNDDDLMDANEAFGMPTLSPSLDCETESIDSSPPHTPCLDDSFMLTFGHSKDAYAVDDSYKVPHEDPISPDCSASTDSLCLADLVHYVSGDNLCSLSLSLPSCDSFYDLNIPDKFEAPTITVTDCNEDNKTNYSYESPCAPHTPSTSVFYELGLPTTVHEFFPSVPTKPNLMLHAPIPIPFAPKLSDGNYIYVPPFSTEEYFHNGSKSEEEPSSDLSRLGLRSTSGSSKVASDDYGFNWDRVAGRESESTRDLRSITSMDSDLNSWMGYGESSSTDLLRLELPPSSDSIFDDLDFAVRPIAGAHTDRNKQPKES